MLKIQHSCSKVRILIVQRAVTTKLRTKQYAVCKLPCTSLQRLRFHTVNSRVKYMLHKHDSSVSQDFIVTALCLLDKSWLIHEMYLHVI